MLLRHVTFHTTISVGDTVGNAKKISAPLFEPNTLSEKHLFRMAATKQYDHLTCQGANMSRNRFKLCLKINNTKCMAKLHAGKRQEVRAVF